MDKNIKNAVMTIVQVIRNLGHAVGVFGILAEIALGLHSKKPHMWVIECLVTLDTTRHSSLATLADAVRLQDPTRFSVLGCNHPGQLLSFEADHIYSANSNMKGCTVQVHLLSDSDIFVSTISTYTLIVDAIPLAPFQCLFLASLRRWKRDLGSLKPRSQTKNERAHYDRVKNLIDVFFWFSGPASPRFLLRESIRQEMEALQVAFWKFGINGSARFSFLDLAVVPSLRPTLRSRATPRSESILHSPASQSPPSNTMQFTTSTPLDVASYSRTPSYPFTPSSPIVYSLQAADRSYHVSDLPTYSPPGIAQGYPYPADYFLPNGPVADLFPWGPRPMYPSAPSTPQLYFHGPNLNPPTTILGIESGTDHACPPALTAGRAALGILTSHGYHCAIFGSLACFLYGTTRKPNDADILVLTPAPSGAGSDSELLKRIIVSSNPIHFFLKDSVNPEATYKVLHYRESQVTDQKSCKVDIVLPGNMHLPAVPPGLVSEVEGIPLIPFSLLLLQKIQGWHDHRTAPEEHKQKKQHQDKQDITALLSLPLIVPLRNEQPWSSRALFSEEFEQLSRSRVQAFCKMFPSLRPHWRLLGFEFDN